MKRLAQDGELDIERSEIYQALFGELASADHARKACRVLDLCVEADECVVPGGDGGDGGGFVGAGGAGGVK